MDRGTVDEMAVWQAVGLLAAVHSLTLDEALAQLCMRGIELRVHPEDVAQFVLWRVELPV